MGRGLTPGTRAMVVVSIAAAFVLGTARDASAQTCDAGVFASAVQAPAGASVRITRSVPVLDPGGTEWALQACFVLSQHGPAPAPVSATIDLRQPGHPAPFYRLDGAQLFSVGGLPSVCQVQSDELHLTLASTGPLPPHDISEECCVLAHHPTTPSCELLPHEPDDVHVKIDTPGQPAYLTSVAVADRKEGGLSSGGGGGGGGGCGLTGIEFVGIPLALLVMRARSGRRLGGIA